MRVLLFGTYDAAVHPRVAVLADGLRAHGVVVQERNEPLGLDTAARVAMLRQPWRLPLLAWRLARSWATLAHRGRAAVGNRGRAAVGNRGRAAVGNRGRAAVAAEPVDAVLVGYLGHFDVLLARRLFPRTTIVLDHLVFAGDTARDRGEAGSVKQHLLRRLDRAALTAADVVVVDTEEHRAQVPADLRSRAVVVPVGAPAAWSAAHRTEPPPASAPLRVVFFGLYTPLQGAPCIGAALALLAEPLGAGRLAVTMVGKGQELATTRAAAGSSPGVTWLDWVPSAELPSLVAAHDVCLGIFGTSPKASNVVPNKVYQGAAAGCAVVTSDTPPQRRVLAGAAVLVPPADPEALAAALLRLAEDREELDRVRAGCAALAAHRFAPARVVDPLLARLAAPPSRTVSGPEGTAVTQPHSSSDRTSAGPADESSAVGRPTAGSAAPAPLAPGAAMRWDVVRRLLPVDASDVLEVGCGQGAFGARLARLVPRYVGIEPDPTSYAVARNRVAGTGHGEVRNLRTDELAPDERFDVVCAFEVLEHLEDDAAAVAEWTARLRPGGTLLLSTPAHADRLGAWDELVGHYRRYDAAGMAELLRAAGLVDVEVRLYGFPLGFALENARNVIARRRLRGASPSVMDSATAMEERTASSGRQLQPTRRASALAVRAATAPFLRIQHRFPERGTALVARARRPQ